MFSLLLHFFSIMNKLTALLCPDQISSPAIWCNETIFMTDIPHRHVMHMGALACRHCAIECSD